MKKLLWPVLALFISVLCIGLTSCSNDDDNDGNVDSGNSNGKATMQLPNGKKISLKYAYLVIDKEDDETFIIFCDFDPSTGKVPDVSSAMYLDLYENQLKEGTIAKDDFFFEGFYNYDRNNYISEYELEIIEDESSELKIKQSGNTYEISISKLCMEYEDADGKEGEYTTSFYYKGEIPVITELPDDM